MIYFSNIYDQHELIHHYIYLYYLYYLLQSDVTLHFGVDCETGAVTQIKPGESLEDSAVLCPGSLAPRGSSPAKATLNRKTLFYMLYF